MINVNVIENFKDYGRCAVISNGVIEAYLTLDLGPRIIRFGYVGGQNIMNDDRANLGELCDDEFEALFGKGRKWELLGGHRIWLSPESYPECYTPDDREVAFEITENGAIFTAQPDSEIGILKSMEIKMDNDDANMQVIMRVKNISDAPKDFAIWALTVCAQNGDLIVPMNTNDTGLLANRYITAWPYTNMGDSRVYWGNKYVTLHQQKGAENKFKLGFDLNCGTGYYVLGDDVFCKRYKANHPNGNYPDGGCSFEAFTNGVMLEFETLGELKTVKAGEESEHTEHWSLVHKPCNIDFKNDDSITEFLKKL